MSENYLELNEELVEEFLVHYGRKVPDPMKYPKQFAFLWKSFIYYRERNA